MISTTKMTIEINIAIPLQLDCQCECESLLIRAVNENRSQIVMESQ